MTDSARMGCTYKRAGLLEVCGISDDGMLSVVRLYMLVGMAPHGSAVYQRIGVMIYKVSFLHLLRIRRLLRRAGITRTIGRA